ncbi:TerD family protein [Paenibacillus thiaminolyticus]|uniref:Cytoplasmic protein n=1 Tax=Paenibacillus thiaminolyticus TaxID=49283 RepID=A0A3A3GFH3_PANTH|nr:TerD family protein [Paenibacillus thiaminolyticus]RJG22834.1 cytoplasmic protein [Paenibacillus thiaminolyticus]
MMQKEIYLRRSRKVIVVPEQSKLPDAQLATAMKNIAALGFTCSPALLAALRTLSEVSFFRWYKALIHSLKKLVGAHVAYPPMYPNFPEQVMDASDAELYLNAWYHYVTNEVPEIESITREIFRGKTKLEIIELGSEEHFRQVMRELMQANTSISDTDKQDLAWVIEHDHDIDALLPDVIPHKEQVGFIAAALLRAGKADVTRIQRYVRTATDVLRLAVAWSDGDVSLAASTPFRKFTRAERRLLLGLLEQCQNSIEDMLRYRDRWVRLGEILHPSEYKSRYPRSQEAFDVLRNNRPYASFGHRLEESLRYFDTDQAVEQLLERPGEFARRLDHLLRLEGAAAWIASFFASVADRVATPVLLQVMTHFKYRQYANELRLFFPKGNVAKAFSSPDTRPPVAPDACATVVETCEKALIDRFAKQPDLGKVYLDPQLQNYMVPFSQRSASKSLRTLVRGSKLAMPAGETIRFFLWWKEGVIDGKATGRTDIDLSAALYDDAWNYKEHISYTNLRSARYKAAHSGDIVSAPHGACEFIDIDIPSVLQYGGRYIVATLHSFTGQAYSELPECFAGWMMRQHPNSGELFEPETVVDRLDLTANMQIAIPAILDLAERTVIWCDLALTRNPQFNNNVEGHQSGIVAMGKAMTTIAKPNLYELFRLHALARGQLVEREGEAQTVFSVQRGITPFDMEEIMGSFLAS